MTVEAVIGRFKGWIVTYVTGHHMFVPSGDPRSRLFTLRQTFSVLPPALQWKTTIGNEVVDVSCTSPDNR
ncbi:hypothetical protein JCM19039_4223 [Geomicrobium sp. JCM 19039]|nr:hypothetical protein JCM19039_4223 [Geomicrobium sp. JCM 19039]